MRKKLLSCTDLVVSAICLGTVNYGTNLQTSDSHRQLSQFVEAGGNFIDTAHVYGDWEPDIKGRSERVIGEWMLQNGMRENIILATKGAHPLLDSMHISRLRPQDIERDLSESLEYLCTDYIDLYFLHRDDPSIPVDEIIDYLEEQVVSGRIKYYGASNWRLDRLNEAHTYAKGKNFQGFVCNQLMWSLAGANNNKLPDKTMVAMDTATYKYHSEIKINVMAYMALAKGYFSQRQAMNKLPKEVEDIYSSKKNNHIFDELTNLSNQTGLSVTDLSLLFFEGHPFLSIPIASFDTEQQLQAGINFADLDVDNSIVEHLRSIWSSFQ